MSERSGNRFGGPVGETPGMPMLTSVWPTGATSVTAQLDAGGYEPSTGVDLALMPPAIAHYAIAALTRPGDIVLDPDCGAGTTVVEALRAGRHAIGLTSQRRWWSLARANVTATKSRGAFVDGMVLILDRRPGTALAAETAGLTGRVGLLLTTVCPAGPDDEIAEALGRLQNVLSEYRPLLRPGGHVVITCAPSRHPARYELLDVPGRIVAVGSALGLVPVARCLALTAGVRRRVHTHATLAERRAVARAERALGHPISLPAHQTVLVFRADPKAADLALSQPISPLPEPLRRRPHTPRPRPLLAAV